VNLRPLPQNTAEQDLRTLAEIDFATSALDLAFSRLSDRSFACLSRSYQRLADAVLRVVAERARFAS
jgi:hypothetical protein